MLKAGLLGIQCQKQLSQRTRQRMCFDVKYAEN